MADYYRDVTRLLRENSYEFKRPRRGDHEIWWNSRTGICVSRPQVEVQIYRKWNFKGSRDRKGILISVAAAGLPPPVTLHREK